MAQLRFSNLLMANTGKSGEMVPDADGYYDVALCSFNIHSKMGDYFSMEGVEKLFEAEADLMKRCRAGSLYIENGHPYQLLGQSDSDYFMRVMTIQEDRFCGHIRELYIDWDFGKNNPHICPGETVVIRGLVKPYGEHKAVLEEAFKNRHQNLAFSVRGLSDLVESRSGNRTRYMTSIVTFDFVGDPAMGLADRHTSLSLLSGSAEVLSDKIIDPSMFASLKAKASSSTITLQSSTRQVLEETMRVYESRQTKAVVDNGLYDFLK